MERGTAIAEHLPRGGAMEPGEGYRLALRLQHYNLGLHACRMAVCSESENCHDALAW